MIVAVDGNAFAGKTSLATEAGRHGATVVPEYHPEDGDGDALERQQAYLDQEVGRMHLVADAGGLVLLDRSFLSLAAHVWCLFETRGVDILDAFAARLGAALRQRTVVVPDLFVHLEAPWSAIEARAGAELAMPNGRGTPRDLTEAGYCRALDRFHRAWSAEVGQGVSVRLDAAPPERLWLQLQSRIRQPLQALGPEDVIGGLRRSFRRAQADLAPREGEATEVLGTHVLVEMFDCDPDRITDVEQVMEAMLEAARDGGATIVGHFFHQFIPQGVSGAVIVAESHLSIHTWPEHRFAALDLFACSRSLQVDRCLSCLRRAFRCGDYSVRTVPRGDLSAIRARPRDAMDCAR